MKNFETEEIPKLSVERNPVFLSFFVLLSLLLAYVDYRLFTSFNPWGFIIMIPAMIAVFQSLWLLLNPFAHVYDNRVEIKHHLFSNKVWYFTDIKKLTENGKGQHYVVYTDDEVVPMNLSGIRKSQLKELTEAIQLSIRPKGNKLNT